MTDGEIGIGTAIVTAKTGESEATGESQMGSAIAPATTTTASAGGGTKTSGDAGASEYCDPAVPGTSS